jgi:RNA polymerase sigma-70 factor, ECF subfamily
MQTTGSKQVTARMASPSVYVSQRSPLPRDEELLLEYAATGNQDAFAELVELYKREIYNHLRKCLHDDQLAEDALQNTFLQLHRKCRQFDTGRRLRPWPYTIATHQAIDLLRRNRRHRMLMHGMANNRDADWPGAVCGNCLPALSVDPDEQLRLEEDCRRTRLAMKMVPAKARQVLTLIAYRNLLYREAAEVLGIPVGTVKSRMQTALQNLHKALLAVRYGRRNYGFLGALSRH